MPGIRSLPAKSGIPGMGERAYAYAKVCGILGKSFTGKKMRRLETVNSLSELDRMVFPSAFRDLPEKELLVDLEDRIINRSADSVLALVKSFQAVPEFLRLLVRGYEYTDLKNSITAIMEGERIAPVHYNLGNFQTVRFSAWPDIKAMIKGTEFGFLLDSKGSLKYRHGIALQSALDHQYYSALWEALFLLPPGDRRASEKILAEEISLLNSGWVLRLRTYYQMPDEEIKSHFIDVSVRRKHGAGSVKSTAFEALQCLDFPLDTREAWASWRWKEFLNTDPGEIHWQADPRHFQNAAAGYLYRLALHYFRSRPFSLDTVFCFIKLKQFEEDLLTSWAEGLGMGMSSHDIVSLLGVKP